MFHKIFVPLFFLLVSNVAFGMDSVEKMALVPGGEFLMGTNRATPAERPVHNVRIRSFYLDRFETSNADYEKFDPGHRRSALSQCDKCPATLVAWKEADAYCRKRGGRLPTEAEWEWSVSRNYPEESFDVLREAFLGRTFDAGAAPVDFPFSGEPGIYHLQGNVWEWLNDWFGSYPGEKRDNPVGPRSGTRKVVRGGGWYSAEVYANPRLRFQLYPEAKINSVGFRCAMDAD